MMTEFLILVDENDNPLDKMEKLMVHQLGLLHRAFSVFIFNTKGELLMQQRAASKYHSGGLWTNTCCSHPRFGEEISSAIDRRLQEEMGMHCKTSFAFSFTYKTTFANGLTEHEFDHVYFGVTDETPIPEKAEVENWKYVSIEKLENDIMHHPEMYTEWMKISLPQVKAYFKDHFTNKIKEYASV
jgi:isopentenyl-diphosphate delta-isomerase